MPALNRAREQGRRAACQANLKTLTLGWLIYADENGDKIVNGAAGFHYTTGGSSYTTDGTAAGIIERAWVGKAWPDDYASPSRLTNSVPRDQQLRAIQQGALWSAVSNDGSFRCPTGLRNEWVTYAIVDAMNGLNGNNGRNGVSTGSGHTYAVGTRVGKTVLWIKRKTEIVSPTAAERMVFIDEGAVTPDSFAVNYPTGAWWDNPPVRHGDGTTVSWADGHAQHLKWSSTETIEFGRDHNAWYGGGTFNPQTDEGQRELREFRKWVWGKSG